MCDDAQSVAKMLLPKLHLRFPTQLPLSAIKGFDIHLPRDIGTLTNDHLLHLTRSKGLVDFILGGWECHMISAASKLQGIHDPRFTYFFDLVRSTNYLSKIQEHPLLYLFENTYPLGDVPDWVHNTIFLV